MWCIFFGSEHREGRVAARHTLDKLHEAHPDLFPTPVPRDCISMGRDDIPIHQRREGGATKMARLIPRAVRKGEFGRKALSPMSDGRSRWGYPTTFLMTRPTGFWLIVAVPRLGEKAARFTWVTFLNTGTRRKEAGWVEVGEEEQAKVPPNAKYPSGRPLTLEEAKSRR